MPWFGKTKLSDIQENVFELGAESIQTFGDPQAAHYCLSPESELPIVMRSYSGEKVLCKSAESYIQFMKWLNIRNSEDDLNRLRRSPNYFNKILYSKFLDLVKKSKMTEKEFVDQDMRPTEAEKLKDTTFNKGFDDWWEQHSPTITRRALNAKYEQHKRVIDHALKQSGDRVLVFDGLDPIAGWSSDGQGKNQVGMFWMERRFINAIEAKNKSEGKKKKGATDLEVEDFNITAQEKYKDVQYERAAYGQHESHIGNWLQRDLTKAPPKDLVLWHDKSPFDEPKQIGTNVMPLKRAINQLMHSLKDYGATACRIGSAFDYGDDTLCIKFSSKEEADHFREQFKHNLIVPVDDSIDYQTSVVLTKVGAIAYFKKKQFTVESPPNGQPTDPEHFFSELKFETSARGQALGAISRDESGQPKPLDFKMVVGAASDEKRVLFTFANHDDAVAFGAKNGITVFEGKEVYVNRDVAQAYMEAAGVGKHTVGSDPVNIIRALEHEQGSPVDKLHLELNRKLTNAMVAEAMAPDKKNKKKDKPANYLGVEEVNIVLPSASSQLERYELEFSNRESADLFIAYVNKQNSGASNLDVTPTAFLPDYPDGPVTLTLYHSEMRNVLEAVKVPQAAGLIEEAYRYTTKCTDKPVHQSDVNVIRNEKEQERSRMGPSSRC